MKTCIKCFIEKDFTCFHKHKSRKDGYREVCKVCRKIETKEYITINSEVLSEKKKKYYIDNKEKINTRNKINNKVWYESNKEKKLEYLKNWYTTKRLQVNADEQRELLLIYNRVFNRKNVFTSCGSCVRNMVRDLEKIYYEYKSDLTN